MALAKKKEEYIDQVLTEALDSLENMRNDPSYPSIINKLAVQGGVAVGGGKITVLVATEDLGKLNTDFVSNEVSQRTKCPTYVEKKSEGFIEIQNQSITREEDLADSAASKVKRVGGVIVTKGSIWADNSFEAIINRRRRDLRIQAAKILFP